MRKLSEEESATAKPIIISEAKCCDCGGECTLFLVPAKVWRGLGIPKDAYICKPCFAHRLNPSITTEEISAEIVKQRRRFNLKQQRNTYCGQKLPYMVLLEYSGGESVGFRASLGTRGELFGVTGEASTPFESDDAYWSQFWSAHSSQFPQNGTPGIAYLRRSQGKRVQECLLFYNEAGALAGFVHYYPQDIPNPAYRNPGYVNDGTHYPAPPDVEFLERAGTCTVVVAPQYRRRGIGSALLEEAIRRWNLNLKQQDYTEAGLGLVSANERLAGAQK